MPYDPKIHHRRSVRLPGHDYSEPGAYFVTICTRDKECSLGIVVLDTTLLSPIGQIVEASWRSLPSRFRNVEVDQFVVMPNHIHGIIWLVEEQTARVGSSASLPTVIRMFKSVSSRSVNEFLGVSGKSL